MYAIQRTDIGPTSEKPNFISAMDQEEGDFCCSTLLIQERSFLQPE